MTGIALWPSGKSRLCAECFSAGAVKRNRAQFHFPLKKNKMNLSKSTWYMAAICIGCMSLALSADAQVRVVSETQAGSGSSANPTRPVYVESTTPGGTSTGSTRPNYFESTAPGGSSTGSTRPNYFQSTAPGGSSTGNSRPKNVDFVTPTVPDKPEIQFGIHPNPAHDVFYVEFSGISQSDPVQINIYDPRGRLMSVPMQRTSTNFRVIVDNLPRGSYIIQISTRGHEITKTITLI